MIQIGNIFDRLQIDAVKFTKLMILPRELVYSRRQTMPKNFARISTFGGWKKFKGSRKETKNEWLASEGSKWQACGFLEAGKGIVSG